MFTYILIIIAFLMLGIYFTRVQNPRVLVGWKFVSNIQVEKIDATITARYMGKTMFVYTLGMVVCASSLYFKSDVPIMAGMAILFIATVVLLALFNSRKVLADEFKNLPKSEYITKGKRR